MIFRKGYKYQLQYDELFTTKIHPPTDIVYGFVELNTDGILKVKKGFAWDGPSGPTLATDNFMRGSLAHDSLYRLMSEGLLDKLWREEVDNLLVKVCKEDGMSAFRCWYVLKGVRMFGGLFINPEKDYEV